MQHACCCKSCTIRSTRHNIILHSFSQRKTEIAAILYQFCCAITIEFMSHNAIRLQHTTNVCIYHEWQTITSSYAYETRKDELLHLVRINCKLQRAATVRHGLVPAGPQNKFRRGSCGKKKNTRRPKITSDTYATR